MVEKAVLALAFPTVFRSEIFGVGVVVYDVAWKVLSRPIEVVESSVCHIFVPVLRQTSIWGRKVSSTGDAFLEIVYRMMMRVYPLYTRRRLHWQVWSGHRRGLGYACLLSVHDSLGCCYYAVGQSFADWGFSC